MVIRRPKTTDEPAIARLFHALTTAGDHRSFHPHPLTPAVARHLAQGLGPLGQPTQDIYIFGFDQGEATAYGMLRGWDEGHAEPSLGIAVHPVFRGQGLARRMLHDLHGRASRRGAATVRLKVYKSNTKAVWLYRSIGYDLTDHDAVQWHGRLTLTRGRLMDASPHPEAA